MSAPSAKRLYRLILRLHRGLPSEMRLIGDIYVRQEFKRHKKADATQAEKFLHAWTLYCVDLSKQLSGRGFAKGVIGKHLAADDICNLSDEQVLQLYELKQETDKPMN